MRVVGGLPDETLRPLDFAPTPARPVRTVLDETAFAADLERLAGEQEEDSGWSLDFRSHSQPPRSSGAAMRPCGRLSWRPGVTFDDAELAAITQPTPYVYGTADPVGGADIWSRVVSLLPQGKLRLVDGAGHMPWFDDPSQVASDVNRFLAP